MDNLFNVNQAAFILKVHPLTIRRYIKEGRLKAVKVGGNVRIKEAALQEFNKDFSPNESTQNPSVKVRQLQIRVFNLEDPLLRLKGRGASLKLS